MANLVRTREAARLLRVDPRTLRKYESPDGRWCLIAGLRFRVFRSDLGPNARRHYDADEIRAALERHRQGQ